MLQKRGWLGLSHVCFQSQTLLLTRRAGCHLFLFAPNRTRVVRVCLCFLSAPLIVNPGRPKGNPPAPMSEQRFQFGPCLSGHCLAATPPRTLAAMTIRSERGPVQMGFPRREAEEVAVYPPPRQTGRSLPLVPPGTAGGEETSGLSQDTLVGFNFPPCPVGTPGDPPRLLPEEEPQSLPRCSTCPASDIDLDLEESTSLSLSNGGG